MNTTDTRKDSKNQSDIVRLILNRLKVEAVLKSIGLQVCSRDGQLDCLAGDYHAKLLFGFAEQSTEGVVILVLLGEISQTDELDDFIKSQNASITPFEIQVSDTNGLMVVLQANFSENFDPQAVVTSLARAIQIADSIEPALSEDHYLKRLNSSDAASLTGELRK